MNYEVLSPWAQIDKTDSAVMRPRMKDLNGKTIGLFSHFKEHSPLILKEVERQLAAKFPSARFSHYQYARDTTEIVNDEKYKPSFAAWLSSVDSVVSAYGDAGSCSMFLAYNCAAIETMGKPAVMLVKEDLAKPAQRGASARNVPYLRMVKTGINDLSMLFSLAGATENVIRPAISLVIDDLITALTTPLTDEEKSPRQVEDLSELVYVGNINEVNNFFYMKGWTNGLPIAPPTTEAVAEMLKGTDLPPDHIVARIPPMLGKATVKKIAINAVMAGCLPTYMPVLIAAVQGMVDPVIHLEGWTCSVASWAPLILISGPIRKDLDINSGGAIMSPYNKANATIARAIALMIMNIGGVRPTLEDMSEMGHEARFGMCIGENEEMSPWQPFHTDYGMSRDDSAVTLFWPTLRLPFFGKDAAALLSSMCAINIFGWDPGCAFILSPGGALKFAEEGWKKKDVLSYITEYARKPASDLNIRWLKGNNHLPKDVVLPVNPSHSARVFWSTEHLLLMVGGSNYGSSGLAYGGGGDHGGPVCKKIQLPKNWENLASQYKILVPSYLRY
jgi:hypothetical protein